MGKDTRPVFDVLGSVIFSGIGPHLCPVLVRVDLWVSEHQVDAWVVGNILADGQVNPVFLSWEVRSSSSVTLHDLNHIPWPNAAFKEQPGRTEGTSREDDATFLGKRHESCRSDVGVVGLHAGDPGAVTNDMQHLGVLAVEEVLALHRGLVVGRNWACAFPVDELVWYA